MKLSIKFFIFYFIFIYFISSCAPKTIQQVEIKRPEVDAGNELFNRAELLFQEKVYDQALSAYKEYLFQSSNRSFAPAAMMKIGVIYTVKGNYEKARYNYEQLLELFPESTYAKDAKYEIVASFYNEGKYKEAINQALKQISPDLSKIYSVKIYMILSDAYIKSGLVTDALKAYLSAYEIADESEKINISEKIKAMIEKSNSLELSSISSKIENTPFYNFLIYQLGQKYIKEEKFQEALKTFSMFIEKFPTDEKIQDIKDTMVRLNEIGSFDRYSIGVLLPLSGSYSKYGDKALRGIQFALNQFNEQNIASGGQAKNQFKLLIKDSGATNDKMNKSVKELIDSRVAAIIGPLSNAEIAASQSQAKGIPIITLTQKDNINEIGDYVFRNLFTPKMQVKTIANYIIGKLGLKKIAILYPNESYGNTFMNLFRNEISELGGQVVKVEPYKVGETDFIAPIKKMAKPSVDFEALFIPDAPKTAGLIIPQLAYYDIKNIQLIGTNLWHSDNLLKTAKSNAQGAIMPDIFFVDSSLDIVKKFVNSYESTFKEKPEFIEAVSYDTAMILFNIISHQNITSRNILRDEIKNIKDFPGVTGLTSFDDKGEVHKKLFLLKIEGDKFIEIEN